MTTSYTPDGKQALFVGDVGEFGALSSPTKVGGLPVSAVIESQSTTRADLTVRMTNAQLNAIPVLTPGMYGFNTDNQALAVYTNLGWRDIGGPTSTQYMSGTLSAANIAAMFAAGISLIPAQGANTAIIVNRFLLQLVSDGTAFTGGGGIYLQYGNTAHAGISATPTIGLNLLTTPAAAGLMRMSTVSGAVTNAETPDYINTPVAITNAAGAAFAAGGASTVNWKIWFSIIPTT